MLGVAKVKAAIEPGENEQAQPDEDRVGDQQDENRLPAIEDEGRLAEEDQKDDRIHAE